MKLYLVHCGFYDSDVCGGIYEFHVNFLVAAHSFEDARLRAKALPEFRTKRMHIDGLQEISSVSGFLIELREEAALNGQTVLISQKFRELAPAPTAKGEGC